MKYVRTIDKIIKITEKGCIKEFNGKIYAFQDKTYSYRFENGKEIIGDPKDTIEELCDEFVLVKDNYKALLELETNRSIESGFLKDIKTGWLSFIDDINDYLKRNYELYGAIWTKWGLKYVAKMNQKGKLELI